MTEAVGNGPRDGGQQMIYPQVPQPSHSLARTEMARPLGRPRAGNDGQLKTQIEGPGCLLAHKGNPGRPIQSHTVLVVQLRTGGNRDRERLVFWGSHDVWEVAIRISSTHILLPAGQTSPLQCQQCLARQALSWVSGMVIVTVAHTGPGCTDQGANLVKFSTSTACVPAKRRGAWICPGLELAVVRAI